MCMACGKLSKLATHLIQLVLLIFTTIKDCVRKRESLAKPNSYPRERSSPRSKNQKGQSQPNASAPPDDDKKSDLLFFKLPSVYPGKTNKAETEEEHGDGFGDSSTLTTVEISGKPKGHIPTCIFRPTSTAGLCAI